MAPRDLSTFDALSAEHPPVGRHAGVDQGHEWRALDHRRVDPVREHRSQGVWVHDPGTLYDRPSVPQHPTVRPEPLVGLQLLPQPTLACRDCDETGFREQESGSYSPPERAGEHGEYRDEAVALEEVHLLGMPGEL